MYQNLIKSKAKSKILQTYQSFIPDKKVSLQIGAPKEVKELWRFSRVTVRAGYHKERASGQNYVQARIRE